MSFEVAGPTEPDDLKGLRVIAVMGLKLATRSVFDPAPIADPRLDHLLLFYGRPDG